VKTLTSLQLGAAELVVFCSLGTLLNGPLFAVVLALLPGGLLLNELWHLEEGMEEEHHSNYLAHVQRCNILEQGAKGAADAVVLALLAAAVIFVIVLAATGNAEAKNIVDGAWATGVALLVYWFQRGKLPA